ncbi:MAG: PD-(D/E)XK nuclease family protein [Ardenticatenales bacterium]|nr:PD-(D/E)XK nuclease family protein [Ardenticatenales bacterium]
MSSVFDQIAYDEASHTYTLNGQALTSVGRMIDYVKQPFDAPTIAARTAAKTGQTVEEVLAMWETKRVAAQQRGERVHRYIERVLRGQQDAADSDTFLALNDKLPEEHAFDSFWEQTGSKLQVLKTEWIVGDAELGVAGRLDSLFSSPATNRDHVWDWKTGSRFNTSNRWQILLPPFDDLDDCEFNCYSLQLSLYRLIVERNLQAGLGDSTSCTSPQVTSRSTKHSTCVSAC